MAVYSLNDPLPLTAAGSSVSFPYLVFPYIHSHTEEVGDRFFEHTVTDVQLMHSDLKRQAYVAIPFQPMMSRFHVVDWEWEFLCIGRPRMLLS